MNSRNVCIGDRIDITPTRKVVVTHIDDFGLQVCWFTPNGVGPFYSYLPHAELNPIFYENEAAGQHKHWSVMPEFGGEKQ